MCATCREERDLYWKQRVSTRLDEEIQSRKANPKVSLITTSMEDTQVSYDRAVQAADQEVKAELIKRETERLTREKIALIDAYGEDPFDDGTVIRFRKQHRKGGTTYTYTAVRYSYDETTEDAYWRTSNVDDSGSTHTWGNLIEFLVSGPFPTASFEVMKAERTFPTPNEA